MAHQEEIQSEHFSDSMNDCFLQQPMLNLQEKLSSECGGAQNLLWAINGTVVIATTVQLAVTGWKGTADQINSAHGCSTTKN